MDFLVVGELFAIDNFIDAVKNFAVGGAVVGGEYIGVIVHVHPFEDGYRCFS